MGRIRKYIKDCEFETARAVLGGLMEVPINYLGHSNRTKKQDSNRKSTKTDWSLEQSKETIKGISAENGLREKVRKSRESVAGAKRRNAELCAIAQQCNCTQKLLEVFRRLALGSWLTTTGFTLRSLGHTKLHETIQSTSKYQENQRNFVLTAGLCSRAA